MAKLRLAFSQVKRSIWVPGAALLLPVIVGIVVPLNPRSSETT